MTAAVADRPSVLPEALNRLTVMDVARAHGMELRVGAQRSPFREDRKPSFSVLRDGQGWKDHATGESGKVWAFAKLCRPETSDRDLALYLIGLAGLGDDPAVAAAVPAKAPVKKTARKFEHSAEWPSTVEYRWREGQGAVDAAAVRRLAERRGWPDAFVHELIGQDLLSYPLLPWCDYHEEKGRRGWAFKVQRMVSGPAGFKSVDVGYHQTFEVPEGNGKFRKSWVYVPYIPNPPAEGRKWSVFQERLAELEMKVAPYPFYFGSMKPTALYIFEGQWDAATFRSVIMEDGFNPEKQWAALGLRGNQSVDATIEMLAPFIRHHRPAINLWPDNDKAGSTWTSTEIGKAPCFRDRLLACPGCYRLLVFRVQQAKDFNDLYRLRKFSRGELVDMMINALHNEGKVVLP